MVLETTVVKNVGSIDNSPPERVPHEEYIGKDLAKARLLMPLKVSGLEKKIESMEDLLADLDKKTTELFFLFKERYYILEFKKNTVKRIK